MAERDIKALHRLSSRQYLFTRRWRKRIHDDCNNKFRLHGPRALNADETATRARADSLSIVARAALKLLNLGITTAEKLMKFNAIA